MRRNSGDSAVATIKAHLRQPWDRLFVPGVDSHHTRVRNLVRRANDLKLNVMSEYLTDHPAPGLSGVMFTLLPAKMPKPAGGWRLNRYGGL